MQQVTNIQQLETAINQNGEMVISKDNNNIIPALIITAYYYLTTKIYQESTYNYPL